MRRLTHGKERSGRRALRATALLTLLTALLAVPSTAGAVAPGGFDQLANPMGCLTATGNGGVCGTFHDFSRSFDMVISPDGKNLYAAGLDSSTLLVFDRNPNTGALTQKAGDKGCMRNGAATPTCRSASNMSGPIGLAITPNGGTVYLAGYFNNTVVTFTRASDGSLTQKPGTQGCIADTASASCRDGRALGTPSFLTISNDGKQLYVGSEASSSVTALAIDGSGVLTQIGDGSGGAGCVEDVPTVTNGCADGRALAGPFGINAASDSNTIYVATYGDASISALARDPGTGRLSPLPGVTGCIDNANPAKDGCTSLTELSSLRDVAGAPGGQHIYVPVEGGDRVLLFDRQPSGGLIRRAGAAGCVSNGPVAGCTTGRGLGGPAGITVSPDGDDVYVASQGGGGLVELNRAGNGVLTPRPDSRGCAAAAPPANCATLRGVDAPYDVKLSPDGKFIYVNVAFSTAAIGVFKRDSSGPVCGNGSATVTHGTLTNLQLPCTDPDGNPVSFTIVNPPTIGGLGLIDEANDRVGYAASQGQCGTTAFTFRASSSGQTSANRTFALTVVGCPPPPPGGGGTPPPSGPTLIASTVTNRWLAFSNFTKSSNLSVNNLPAGATVRVTCKTKRKNQQKKGCPYKTKRVAVAVARAKLNLRKPFAKKRLPVGTKITITITAPNTIGKRITYTVRKRAVPKVTTRCLPPGGKASTCV